MRKYRGLTKETKRRAYGWYCEIEGRHWIVLDDAELTMDFDGEFAGFVEVLPKTVGQFIGKGMNGDVYANSIVWFCWRGKKIKAKIVDTGFFYHLESCEGEKPGLPRTICKSDMSHIETDPDLMEKAK